MIKHYLFVLTLSISMTFVSAASASTSPQDLPTSNQSTRYFAKLAGVISPMLEYTPRGEVTEQQAKTINHYEVEYDQQGRLSQMRFFQGETPSSSAYFGAHQVSYAYAKDQHRRSYFDEKGQPAVMSRHYYRGGDVHEEIYHHSGNTTTLKLYNSQVERIAVGTGSYEFTAINIDNKRFIQRQFKQDGSANIIFDYLPFEVSMITKDGNDHLYQIINLDPDSLKRSMNTRAGFSEMRLNFDQYGNELGWDFRDLQGNLVNRPDTGVDGGYAVWQYQTNWINQKLGLFNSFTEIYRKADGSTYCKANGVCRVLTHRDNRGNYLGWEYLDERGKLIANPDDQYAKIVIERDKQGNRKAIKYFDAQGQLRRTGIAETRYQRDTQGNEIATNYDANGKSIDG